VVAGDWSRDRLYPSPARVVRLLELRQLAVLVLDVPERQHRGQITSNQQVGHVLLSATGRGARAAFEVDVARVAGDVPGRRAPSRLEKLFEEVLVVVIARLTKPSPVTTSDTSSGTDWPAENGPVPLATGSIGGAFAWVIDRSPHVLLVTG